MVTEAGGKPKRAAEVADRLGLDTAGVRADVQLHKELDDAWERHKGHERYQEDGYITIPVVGTRQPTLLSATWDGARLTAGHSLPPGQEGLPAAGDGTVPQVAAIPMTQSASKDFRGYFVAEHHGSLQNQAFVLGDLVARLNLLQSAKLADVREEIVPQLMERELVVEADDANREGDAVILRSGGDRR